MKKERGIYLMTPQGDIIAELRYDSNWRARDTWYKDRTPTDQDMPDSNISGPASCNPSNPTKLCQG